MPTYRITTPDGKTYNVTAPAGATKEDILARVQEHHGSSDLADLVAGKHKLGAVEQFRQNLRLMPQGGLASGVIDAGDAVQHHVIDSIKGVGQLGAHGLESALGALGLDSFAAQQHAVNTSNDASLRKREASYQRRTPDGVASYGGAAVGEVLPWLYGAGELRALGLLPKVEKGVGLLGKAAEIGKKGGLLALEGGAYGASRPALDDGGFASQKVGQIAQNAVLNPLTVGGLHVGGKGLQGLGWLAKYATPAGRDVVANARVDNLLKVDPAQLRVPSSISGLDFTPAQVLQTPEAVQAERILRNNGHSAPAFAAKESANNAVLRQTVANVAGLDDQMTAAIAARRARAQAFRGQSLPDEGSALVDPTPVVGLLQKLTLAGNDTVRGAAKKHLSLLQQHMEKNGGMIPATALDDIRQGVGSTLRSIPQHGAVTPQEVAQYAPVSTAITDTLERAVPGYRDHLAAYASDSAPINDMEAGRSLLAAIDSGTRDGGGNQAVSLAPVKALLSKDNRAEYPMSDTARQQIEAVMEALQQRSVAHNSIAAAGPGTAADAGRSLQASPLLMRILNHAGTGMGGLLGYGMGDSMGGMAGLLAGATATEGAQALNAQVAKRVGEKAASAKLAAEAIEANRLRKLGKHKPNLLDYLLPYDQGLLPPP